MSAQQIKVPDIGDFSDIPVIEIHVAAGDTVAAEDPCRGLLDGAPVSRSRPRLPGHTDQRAGCW